MSGLLVFLGGGLGAVGRWALGIWVPAPYGTLVVNVFGSAFLACLMHPSWGLDPRWQLALGTGCMGGFTTYSAFNLELLEALQGGRWGEAALSVVGTFVGCLLAGALGYLGVGWLRA